MWLRDRRDECIMCGHCVAVCPKAAVSMTGFDEPPIEIDEPTVLDPLQLLKAIRT
ncbi:NADH-quinone oxidoreductase subunit I [Clostridium transplantifaecale]|uniref:NADH-quinone oxidoreductase subunit I n=1 Tax=Clostridium transplantifaecale TaxID=2479838 RepID=UPI000F63A777|nr:4Fe-4S binding protein [Clostridium transplantifaecale]